MKLTDISNREIANLKTCDSEPIHIPGSIQEHGFLLGLDAEHNIEVCSANVDAFLHRSPADVIGRPLADIADAENIRAFDAYLAAHEKGNPHPFVFRLGDVSYNTTVHQTEALLLLELEALPAATLSLEHLYGQTQTFVGIMNGVSTLHDLCRKIALEVRALTGYDRVMIYRFDKNYNGEVYAEAVKEGLNPYLGHRYPHTDIPAQARQLYLRNLLRMIVDIDYKPVPLLAKDDGTKTNASVDLSDSTLRSVSPIHIEYLRNIGIRATLTISLILDGKLWGMIACHHYTPKNLPHYIRLSSLLQGHFLTSQIRVREVAEDFEVAQEADRNLQEVLPLIGDPEQYAILYQSPALLKLANADGVAVFHNGRLHTGGTVPNAAQIAALMPWLAEHRKIGAFHTAELPSLYEPAKDFADSSAGVLYYTLSEAPSKDCIIWFRAEVEKTYSWAGKPTEHEQADAGKPLTPRKSFELWKEQVKGQSNDWRTAELNAAATFAQALQREYHLRYSRQEEERYRILSRQLQVANDELSNLNWISTHDLKEPLRKIQIFSSKIRSSEASQLSGKGIDTINRIEQAAVRMQTLVEDLLLYSKTIKSDVVYEPMDLNMLVTDVLKGLEYEIAEKDAEVSVSELPAIQAIAFQVRQLFINVIGNALKYTAPGRAPRISIRAEKVTADGAANNVKSSQPYWRISVSDNGIGFDQQFAGKLFDAFQRLHTRNDYAGNGIGLAICRKIMANHQGFITAKGVPDEGAVFQLYFPVG